MKSPDIQRKPGEAWTGVLFKLATTQLGVIIIHLQNTVEVVYVHVGKEHTYWNGECFHRGTTNNSSNKRAFKTRLFFGALCTQPTLESDFYRSFVWKLMFLNSQATKQINRMFISDVSLAEKIVF